MASHQLSNEQLGALAQTRFLGLLQAVGIVANEVRRDMGGWDFFVEVQARGEGSASTLPFDLQPSDIRSLVQVKAIWSDTKDKRCKVTLSNWLRLAKAPMPAFFAVLEFEEWDGGDPRLVNLYFVHLGVELIEKTLRRARELTVSGEEQLHKVEMSLTWSSSEQIAPISGGAVLERIKRDVGDLRTYVETKYGNLSNIGYGRNRIRLRLETDAFASHEEIQIALSEVAVGLRDHVPVRVKSQEDLRFNIPIPIEPRPDMGRMSIASLNGLGPAALALRSLDGRFHTTVRGTLHCSHAYFPFLDPGHLMYRIQARGVDVVWRPRKGSLGMTMNLGPVTDSISESADIARIGLGLSQYSEVKISIRLDNGMTEDLGKVQDIAASFGEELLRDFALVLAVEMIFQRVGLSLHTPVPWQDIHREQQVENLLLIYVQCQPGVVCEIKVEHGKAGISGTAGVLLARAFALGHVWVVLLLMAHGDVMIDLGAGESTDFVVIPRARFDIVGYRIFERDNPPSPSVFDELAVEYARDQQTVDRIINLVNFEPEASV